MFSLIFPSFQNFAVLPVAWVLLILLISASWDIWQRRIPNPLLIGGGLILLLLQWWLQVFYGLSLLIGLTVGLTLWQLKLIGGGDSKLLILVSLAFPPAHLLGLYLSISLVGGLQASLALASKKQNKPLPYAVAIAGGSLLYLAVGIFRP